jgi:hypothetical protein
MVGITFLPRIASAFKTEQYFEGGRTMSHQNNPWEVAQILSKRAEALFLERDSLRHQAQEERRAFQPQIDDLKSRADTVAASFKNLFNPASEAFTAGAKGLAKAISEQGHSAKRECESLNQEVSSLVARMNQRAEAKNRSADEKHREALACIQEAKRLRGLAKQQSSPGFRASQPHRPSKRTPIPHIDVERYDARGRKDKSAGSSKSLMIRKCHSSPT